MPQYQTIPVLHPQILHLTSHLLIEVSALGDFGTEVDSSGEISGGEFEGAALGESVSEVCSSVEM